VDHYIEIGSWPLSFSCVCNSASSDAKFNPTSARALRRAQGIFQQVVLFRGTTSWFRYAWTIWRTQRLWL